MAAIETDQFLPHPPARVWGALTDPDLLGRWLMPNDFAPIVGRRFVFRTDPAPGFDGVVHCQVLELVPQQRLAISWRGGPDLDTVVTWRLVPEGHGTRLFLVHDGFDPDDQSQQTVMDILGRGWRGHLADRLEDLLAT